MRTVYASLPEITNWRKPAELAQSMSYAPVSRSRNILWQSLGRPTKP